MARDIACMFQEVQGDHVSGQNKLFSGERQPVSKHTH